MHWIGVHLFATLLAASTARSEELVDLVKKVEPSVVRIDTKSRSGGGTGSGVIVDARGIVLTNHHVVEEAQQVTVTLRSGDVLKSPGFLAVDAKHDLAIIQIDAVDDSRVMPLAKALPSVGERVAAFGNPQGLSFSASEGIVSGIRNGGELREALGNELLNFLGYADTSIWIQTTAPISPGNSGGPLVTMKGQLVGLNTWHAQGQNLNFAICLDDIRRIWGEVPAGSKPLSFTKLPRSARALPTPNEPEQPPRLENLSVELPTGRVFSYGIFFFNARDINLAARVAPEDQVIIRHTNGSNYAVAGQVGGQLHGATIGQYENKQLMVALSYHEGKRHGVLQTYSEAGDAMLFAQYAHGKRNGLAVWHDEGVPRLILQYKQDVLEWIQVMEFVTPLEGFESRELAERNELAKASLEKLDLFEANLKKSEITFRKQVKEFEMARRRALAAQLAPEKRRMQSARGQARAAAEHAFLQELYRKAAGR
jgi:hypothetical protein